jgi:hypothetical protein
MTVYTNRETLDLAGSWALVFDQDNQGVKLGWCGPHYPNDLAETVPVPEIWNITYPGTDGVGFYKTHFTLPSTWQSKGVELVFEGVSYLTAVWINGKFVGSHEGAYTPFRINITECLHGSEENYLVVRVSSLSKSKAVDGIHLSEAPAAKQSWYFPFGGIWGNVHIESLPILACHSVRLTPDLQQQQVHVEVNLQNTLPFARQADLKLTIKNDSNDQVAELFSQVNIPPGTSRFSYHISIPSPQLWTCQNPSLYLLKTEVFDPLSKELDVQETSFGMREFTMREGQFFLNGEPIYIRGVLLQPDYPISVVTPPDHEMMERELRLVKEAGFNLIRIHLRPAAPGLLDLTDEMGILVYAETSLGWIKDSPRLMEHGLRETEALISRDYNHPSIVFWGIYNENPPAANINGQALSNFARSLDDTRVVVHNSGGSLAIDQDFGWIDRTWVLPAHDATPQKMMDIHLYLGCNPTLPIYKWMQTVGTNANQSTDLCQQGFGSQPIFNEFDREMHTYRGKVFVSEVGCGGFNDMDQTAAGFNGWEKLLDAQVAIGLRDSLYKGFQQRGLEQVFGSVPRLFEKSQEMQSRGIARQVEAVMTNPQISGFIITQLNDVGWELEAGILDLWRNPKPAYQALKRLNQPHCLVTAPQTYAISSGCSTWMDISLLNQVPLEGSEQIVVTIQNQSGDEISRQSLPPVCSAGLHSLNRIRLEAGESGDCYHVSARLLRGKAVLAESTETIHCLPPVQWEVFQSRIYLWGPIAPLFRNDDFVDFFVHAGSSDPMGQMMFVSLPSELSAEEWDEILRMVKRGGNVLIGALDPSCSVAVKALKQAGITIELHPGYGSWLGCHHWIPETDLLEGLPYTGGLASEVYTDTLPRYAMTELGGSVLAGCIRSTQKRDMPKEIMWQSDIEQVSYGKGKLIFCQYRLFEQEYSHPVASRLAYNLFRLAHHD